MTENKEVFSDNQEDVPQIVEEQQLSVIDDKPAVRPITDASDISDAADTPNILDITVSKEPDEPMNMDNDAHSELAMFIKTHTEAHHTLFTFIAMLTEDKKLDRDTNEEESLVAIEFEEVDRCEVQAIESTNLREDPNADAEILNIATEEALLVANGWSADHAWIHTMKGWVRADLVTSAACLAKLPIEAAQ